MRFQNYFALSILASTMLISCSSDDDSTTDLDPTIEDGAAGDDTNVDDTTLEIPTTYEFVNEEGETTVNFIGQTTRLLQGEEMLSIFKEFDTDEETLNTMFAGIDGSSAGFTDADLNDTSRILRSKVAASDDYFDDNLTEQSVIREVFDGFITNQVSTFLTPYSSVEEVPVATEGNAGILGNRLVSAIGLEYNQAFNKSLIGALMVDQVVNHYVYRAFLETNQENNTNDVLVEGRTYTDLEHFWDEAYGYAFGNEGDGDSFLYKYIDRVERDADFAGIKEQIRTAFITGRAAIVANDYVIVEEQGAIIQQLISEVVAIRAVHYMQQGKINLANNETIENGDAFHDLSEGYGFIYSLRFTRNSAGEPFFSREEVDEFIDDLEEGTGFWKFASDDSVLDAISDTIAAKFDFTVEQAAIIDSVE